MRIQYRHPKLYQFLISIFYPKRLWKRLSEETKNNSSVFDVGAGHGYAARFLSPSTQYYGIDLNEYFVAHGKKHNINLEVKDIFDPSAYRKSDVFWLIDIVHHVPREKLQKLFDIIFKHAQKKVIIIDPAFVSLTRKYGLLGKFLGRAFQMLDDDGFNKIERWHSRQEYQQLFESRFSSTLGSSFRISQEQISGHHFVVFTKELPAQTI